MISEAQLLEDLTDEQRQAAMHLDGPLLIVAGAGSGKTRVITRRVGYLLAQGVEQRCILAITFTNKAAGEMKSRIGSLLGRQMRDFGRLDQPWPLICTFHSLCLRILKHFAREVGLAPNFSIYDTSDQEKLIKQAIKDADLSTTNFPPSMVQSKISDAKNNLTTPEAFAAQNTDFFGRKIAGVYAKYQKLLQANNAMDFDDLLMRTALAFREHPRVLADLQQRFSYILIDEYQDTNHAQYIIAHLLAQRHQNICVVGDPDQSIYAWRGADISNILDFEKDYPGAKVIRLERNYRSTKVILRIASKLIAHNTQRKEKGLWTENADGEPALYLQCGDEHEEALAVAQQLRRLREQGFEWNQMAVFYRMNSLSRVMEDALRRSGMPYRIARGVDFYHRREIKDVLAYLRAIANPADEISLERIANTPARGISDTTMRVLKNRAVEQRRTLWEMMAEVATVDSLQARAQASVSGFVQLMRRWRKLVENFAADPMLNGKGQITRLMEDVVRTSGYEAYLAKMGKDEKDELENVNELISSAAEYDRENPDGSLEDYLARISLVSDIDALKEAGGSITLMTLHAAKGLEFPVVAIIGMEENILPHGRVREKPEQLEEERRLCFVGITRAQQRLILSRAMYRTMRGIRERSAASRFLAEMPMEDLQIADATGVPMDDRQASRAAAETVAEQTSARFGRGQMVRHPTFGVGRIVDISNMGQHTRAVVDFPRSGRKTLILEYARIELVG